MPALLPEIVNGRLTVETLMKNPTKIRNRIAKLADPQLVLDKFFTSLGAAVEGGGILYNTIKASDFYINAGAIEQRGHSDEYPIVGGADPEPKIALVEDWGGKFLVSDTQVIRNDAGYVDNKTLQLTNTIVRKLNDAAIRAIDDALTGENIFVGNNWSNVVTTGPENTLTPNADRPAADFAEAQMVADLQELGITHNLIVLHPQQAKALKIVYADTLDAVLKSNGLEMFACPRITPGTGYAVQRGAAGVVGFERPLTVETYDKRDTRSKVVQAFAVPAMAVERPYAVKKITGLAG